MHAELLLHELNVLTNYLHDTQEGKEEEKFIWFTDKVQYPAVSSVMYFRQYGTFHSEKINIIWTTSISLTRWPFQWQYPLCNSIILSLFLLKLKNSPAHLTEGFMIALSLPLLMNGLPLLLMLILISPRSLPGRYAKDRLRSCKLKWVPLLG